MPVVLELSTNKKSRQNRFPFHIVKRRPPVVVSVAGQMLEPVAETLSKTCKNRNALLLCQIWWPLEVEAQSIVKQYRRISSRYKNIVFIYLCNTYRELEMVSRCRIPAILCNHNAFVDESLFFIEEDTPQRFDAIYNASVAPYKRCELASDIGNLALIGYDPGVSRSHLETIRSVLGHAIWLNYSEGTGFQWLEPGAIRGYLNQSHVGLCLSQIEGPMFASAEYLLCGLPIVSTISIGGRDLFFDDSYVRLASDSSAAIREAVTDLLQCNISSNIIREKTLEKISQHRARFYQQIEEFVGNEKSDNRPSDNWKATVQNKMFAWQELSSLAEALQELE